MPTTDWIAISSAAFAGLSAIAAAVAVYFPWKIQNSQEILKQAILSLERAYTVLTQEGKETKPPAPDRLNWLTAARHLERYKKLKEKLAFDAHRIVCEEHEEYWRHKFYVCLNAPHKMPAAYYATKSSQNAGIEPRSALIIHEFAKWLDSRDDPIDKIDAQAILSRGEVLNGNYGLRQYLESLPNQPAEPIQAPQ